MVSSQNEATPGKKQRVGECESGLDAPAAATGACCGQAWPPHPIIAALEDLSSELAYQAHLPYAASLVPPAAVPPSRARAAGPQPAAAERVRDLCGPGPGPHHLPPHASHASQAGELQPTSGHVEAVHRAEEPQQPNGSGRTYRAEPAGRASPAAPAGPAAAEVGGHRALLVDWMVQLAAAARLWPESLFAAVSLLDRFVATAQAYPPPRMLQLLAMACVSVACKHEEVCPLRPSELLPLAADPDTGVQLHTAADLQRMEFLLLDALGWRVRAPSTLTFLHRLHHAADMLQPAADPQAPAAAAACGRDPARGGPGAGAVCACDDLGSADPGGDSGPAEAHGEQEGCGRGALEWAMELAVRSLPHGALLPYGHSTLALACMLLGEQLQRGEPANPSSRARGRGRGTAPGSAGADPSGGRGGAGRRLLLAAAAHGVAPGVLAPRLGSCTAELAAALGAPPAAAAAAVAAAEDAVAAAGRRGRGLEQ